MKKFNIYPDSKIEWYIEIPDSWDYSALSHFAKVETGGTPSRKNPDYWDGGQISWLRSGEINKRMIFASETKITEEGLLNSAASVLPINSVLVALNGQGRTKGMVGVLKTPAAISQSLAAFICNQDKLNYKYLYFYLDSIYNPIRGLVGELRDGLNLGLLKSLNVCIPKISTQIQIAEFLDDRTGKIDILITKQKRLIELLEEKRTALISRAVTKGLNPGVEMKDSGVEWLGEIPKHWVIAPLKYFVKPYPGAIKTGPFGSQLLNSEMEGKDVKVYNQKNVIDEDVIVGDKYISHEKYFELREFEVFPGDILVTTRGSIGKCMILSPDSEKGILHPCLLRIQINPSKVFDKYLVYLLGSSYFGKRQLLEKSNATTIDVIYSSTMKDINITLPPLNEQKNIVKILGIELNIMDKLIKNISESIDKLEEYRTALISAAVTGKIDVRDHVQG